MKRQNIILDLWSSMPLQIAFLTLLGGKNKKAEVCSINVAGEKVLLVKPQTFMNASGESIGPLMRYYKIDPSDVYCIYDDMDLPVGKLRIRPNGSSGGHNGIKSLISHIGTENFPRFA